jgi:hypothetical protein
VGGRWQREANVDVFLGLAEASLVVPPGAVGMKRFYQVLVLDAALPTGGVFSDALVSNAEPGCDVSWKQRPIPGTVPAHALTWFAMRNQVAM